MSAGQAHGQAQRQAPGRSDRRRPALPTIASRAVIDDGIFARGDLVLCAVSGGPDSTALMHVLARLRTKLGHRLAACGVDHGLRAEAAAELDRAARLAADLDVPFEVVKLEVGAGSNLQARARAARHAALRDVAARLGAAVVATGHTANDRAETLISRLLRGSGPRGLAVLPPRDGGLVRPLVRALRSDVEAYVSKHRIPTSDDPSNVDPRFQRVRIRNEVLPLLASLAPRIVWSLCDLADALASSRDAVDPLAGLNAAQRKAVARAKGRGKADVVLLVQGGRQVSLRVAGDDPREVEPQNTDEVKGGSRSSRARSAHVFSQLPAFPDETAILIQESGLAAPHARRRRS